MCNIGFMGERMDKKLMAFISSTKFGAKFFKNSCERVLKSDVWDSVVHKNDENGIIFDINRCLYKDLCYKYSVKELAPMFCGGDYYVFADLKKLEFKRTETIGEGGNKCDFKFLNVDG